MPDKRLFVVDCDPGVDDALALLVLLDYCSRPENDAELVAITTTHGNLGQDIVQGNALRILDAFGAGDIPVYGGARRPLVQDPIDAGHIHGRDGLGDSNLPPSKRSVQRDHAAIALTGLASAHKGMITLIALGPMTNLALACRLDEEFAHNLKELIWMGGTIYGKGNHTYCAEFNVAADPEAAHAVLKTFRHSTMVSWETTVMCPIQTRIFDDMVLAARKSSSPAVAEFVHEITKSRVVLDFDGSGTSIICDLVAMVAAIDPNCVTKKEGKYVEVELAGKHTRGQTCIDWYGVSKRKPNVSLIHAIRIDRLEELLMRAILRV